MHLYTFIHAELTENKRLKKIFELIGFNLLLLLLLSFSNQKSYYTFPDQHVRICSSLFVNEKQFKPILTYTTITEVPHGYTYCLHSCSLLQAEHSPRDVEISLKLFEYEYIVSYLALCHALRIRRK